MPGHIITSDPSYAQVLPKEFTYGFASASYQIEGGHDQGGRAPSIWDEFFKGKEINGNEAVDSYHLWKEDINLLKQYGANAYRFSISWSRVKPLGGKDDPINEVGIAYYDNLINGLLEAGITPWVTLYHWDIPQELENRYGGWQADDVSLIVEDFKAYAKLLFERYGDRVKNWITLNEPHIFTSLCGFGIKPQWNKTTDPWKTGYSQILGHAHAVDLYRKEFQASQKGQIGITLNCDWSEPLNESEEAKKSSKRYLDLVIGWFADPIYLGHLNPTLKAELGDLFPDFTTEQWALIKGSSDFFGLNHYGTSYALGKSKPFAGAEPLGLITGCEENTYERDGKPIGLKGHNGHPYTVPWGFRKLLRHLHQKYTKPLGLPIIITENGFPVEDEGKLELADIINDTARQAFFESYLKELIEAVRDDGIEMSGYFGWSLLDNLEWVFGYEPRFGVTHVDRENGFKRTPKRSAFLVKEIMEHAIEK